MDETGFPVAQGLYDPWYERAACGVGYVVSIDGQQSNKVRILHSTLGFGFLFQVEEQLVRKTLHFQFVFVPMFEQNVFVILVHAFLDRSLFVTRLLWMSSCLVYGSIPSGKSDPAKEKVTIECKRVTTCVLTFGAPGHTRIDVL